MTIAPRVCLLLMLWLGLMCIAPSQDAPKESPQATPQDPPFPALEPAEIVRRSVEANQKDWQRLPNYDYFVREVEPRGTKTYLSRMILGSRYNQLIAINDQALPADVAAREKQRYENEISARQKETPERRQERIERFEKDRKRNEFFMSQLGVAFDFTLVKTDSLDGRRVYVLAAKPRRGYNPPTMQAKALTGMQGTMWIDGSDFHWVRVRAQVVRPVSIEGFLARIEPGTRFELDQIRITEGLWLPSRFLMASRAKVFLIFPRSNKEEETYSGYRKNDRATDGREPPSR